MKRHKNRAVARLSRPPGFFVCPSADIGVRLGDMNSPPVMLIALVSIFAPLVTINCIFTLLVYAEGVYATDLLLNGLKGFSFLEQR
jgi:hypothetical protein